MQHLAVAVEIAHEGADATFEVEINLASGGYALVDQLQEDAAGDEGHLTEPRDEHLEAIDIVFGEDGGIELESRSGTGAFPFLQWTHSLNGRHRNAALIALLPQGPVASDFHFHPFRQGIHGRRTDAVETT